MGIQDLQTFLESANAAGCSVPVDLLRIARNTNPARQSHKQRGKHSAKPSGLSLVVDGECCLDRLYGGFFSDWACGGQWNRMVQFLAVLIQTVQSNNVELSFFFNGALESQRMSEWVGQQLIERQKINHVLRHVNTKGTPPPKIWWTPPVCLRTCLRMALRHLNVGLTCTMDDHHQEVIAFCRENDCSGLMADDGEYAAFDPPRYFSSEHIKLTYKGSLETKEYVMSEASKLLGLSGQQVCVLGALLGNFLLSEHELSDVHARLGIREPLAKVPIDTVMRVLCSYVKTLPTVDNLDSVTEHVLGSANERRAARFQQSVKYYLNGTKEGFLSYKPQHSVRRSDKGGEKAVRSQPEAPKPAKSVVSVVENGVTAKKEAEESLDYSRLASETMESQQESLACYQAATANSLPAPQIVIDAAPTAPASAPLVNANGTTTAALSTSSSSSGSGAPSPSRPKPPAEEASRPAWLDGVPHEVMRTACERHEKGLMSPLVYQIFTQGELKLPMVMEDECHREIPSVHLLFRPIRQMVYAVLFNMHHHKYLANRKSDTDCPRPTADMSKVEVREWVWSRDNAYRVPHAVCPEPLDWGVPTIQRLWFGASLDDKKRRFRAFLTCMRADSLLMMNPAYVPQHLLVMATVLRFIMSQKGKQVLRKPELDAFIATAFSPELMNAHFLQELQLPMVSSRGVQLAAMFMSGVENALLANDACGAPLPWLMCCPWLYFDGKLFHHKLARTAQVKNLLELCDHRIDLVVKIERMRKAVLEGLDVQFATIPLPPIPVRPNPLNVLPAGSGMNAPTGRSSGMKPYGYPHQQQQQGPQYMLRRGVPARGGQLEVAGVVVGQWGANYGSRGGLVQRTQSARHCATQPPPQVTSVGGIKNCRGYAGRPAYQRKHDGVNHNNKQGIASRPRKKKNNNPTKASRGRGLTVEIANGNVVPVSGISVIPMPMKLQSSDVDDFDQSVADLSGQFDDATLSNGADPVTVIKSEHAAAVKPEANGEELGQGDARI